ncbi:uncharacterized protein DNG_02703 [Cephalotrichum gorgonifer]|uniref:Uncharacterized protein n=1 Tax=Cephalotrichum gorgonifer TaxID=2041049 RepID=A0AAE8MTP2_9PEZI|nr:uncharacterized protein DNG_02703 [Cephalotrichum gorgonifer]
MSSKKKPTPILPGKASDAVSTGARAGADPNSEPDPPRGLSGEAGSSEPSPTGQHRNGSETINLRPRVPTETETANGGNGNVPSRGSTPILRPPPQISHGSGDPAPSQDQSQPPDLPLAGTTSTTLRSYADTQSTPPTEGAPRSSGPRAGGVSHLVVAAPTDMSCVGSWCPKDFKISRSLTGDSAFGGGDTA